MIYLITKLDFPSTVSINMREDQINENIELAQDFDLAPMLGGHFYADFIAKISSYKAALLANPNYVPNTEERMYIELLNGRTYGDPAIEFRGVKKAVAWYAYARIVMTNDFRVNGAGNSMKISDFSDRPSFKAVENVSNEAKSVAYGYVTQSIAYLDAFSSDFKYWETTSCGSSRPAGRTSSLRISGIPSDYGRRFRI